MVKALADRLAEAFAELLHQRVRREWGYGRQEAVVARGSDRRAVSWHSPGAGLSGPTGPHGEDRRCFDLLDAERSDRRRT